MPKLKSRKGFLLPALFWFVIATIYTVGMFIWMGSDISSRCSDCAVNQWSRGVGDGGNF